MGVINSILSWWMKKRFHQIDLFIRYPHDVQLEVFNKLIAMGRNTTWGETYDYDTIKTPQDYKNRVPVQQYEDIYPYIERIMKGEQQVLWPTQIKWFAKSSGTTNAKSKFIPITQEALDDCHFKGGKDMLSMYCNSVPNTGLFDGLSLSMGGSLQINKLNDETSYGDLSAVLMQNLPFWAEFHRTPDLNIALLDQWEEKIAKIGAQTLTQNVTSVSGVPTWTMILFHWLIEKSQKNTIQEIWPNLEVYFHGGVHFGPYKSQFENLISKSDFKFFETYNASEGFFGLQHQLNAPDLMLMLDYGIYFEFIPLSDVGKPFPKSLELHEVALNETYALVITTNSGLWRYALGDTISFTSTDPYTFVIVGRTKHYINAFGEELMGHNAENALAVVTKQFQCSIADYTVAPIFMENGKRGRHQWVIAFNKAPNDIAHFAEALDACIRSLNSDYDAKRTNNMALTTLEVIPVDNTIFYKWLAQKGKLGGQNKVPRLMNDRKVIEEILQIAFTAV